MKKIKLSLDDLVVKTFSTVDVEGRRGTVRGHDSNTLVGGWPCGNPESEHYSECGTCFGPTCEGGITCIKTN